MQNKLRPADWLGFIVIAIVLVMSLMNIFSGSYTTWTILILIAAVALLVMHIRSVWRSAPASLLESEAIASLVLLQRQHHTISIEAVTTNIETAFRNVFEGEAEVAVLGQDPRFTITTPIGEYMIRNHNATYVKDIEAAADGVNDPQLAQALREHQAWVSVDLFSSADPDSNEKAMETLARLAAPLVDDNCLMIYSTATNQGVVCDETLRQRLQNEGAPAVMSTLLKSAGQPQGG